MKVTDKMIYAFCDAPDGEMTGAEAEWIEARLQKVLDLIDLEPFTFTGYPDNPVYLHPPCGTVVDVSPLHKDMRDCVDRGECDCENTQPWVRIYVERAP